MKKIELLAPAGGPEQFKAAVNAGADAVYLGGSLFNARIGAGNFTLDEIEEAVGYGHLRNVKTYVTMNTLLDDGDIPKALKFASKLYEIGVDALIIQDLGLGLVIREAMPDFELHLSTQATIYDPEGVKAAESLGYKRTVLSRELTLEEIKDCAAAGEVEVFAHGALCICYSGQCQLSRFIGGRSGNKGMCAQPCRLPYTHRDVNGRIISSGAVLSPKDMCQIDNLGELIDAGVASLKIEGRMKSSEYVATVVNVYRKYIDEYYKRGSYTVSEKDKTDLLQAFNRDGFSEGYVHGDPGEGLMTSGISKNTGVFMGKVTKVLGRNNLVEVSPSSDISMHDVIEIRDGSGNTSFKVTYLKRTPSGTVVIGDLKDSVSKGADVYRLISSALNDQAEALASDPKKVPIDLFLSLRAGMPAEISAKHISSGISFNYSDPDIIPQPALKAALKEEDIKRQLNKTGDTAFFIRNIRINMDNDLFLPVSRINLLRRNALEGLDRAVKSSFKRVSNIYSIKTSLPGDLIPHDSLPELDEEAIILPIVTKGVYDMWLRDNLTNLAAKASANGSPIVISNPAWIKPFSDAGIKVIGGPGLNITNLYSVKALMGLGMSNEYVRSPELLDRDKMDGVPLMITEHRLTPGTLTDRKGAEYSVEFNEECHKSYIFAK